MSKAWKWILGVLAVLVIVGVVAAVFVWWNHAPLGVRRTAALPQASGTPAPNTPYRQGQPGMPYGFNENRPNHMNGWDFRGPMMQGRGFRQFGGFGPFGVGFFILGGLLRLIIPLAILALVAFLFYRLGRSAGASAGNSASAPATPASPSPDGTPLPGRKVARR
jgi:hypothetical protein